MSVYHNVTPEYYEFIKMYLINTCYAQYCKNIYEPSLLPNKQMQPMLDQNQNDITIWNEIFRNTYTIMNYFIKINMHISPQNQAVHWMSNGILYESELSSSQMSTIYKIQSFQDFVDNKINIHSVGGADYQAFIVSMRTPAFRNRLIEKYHLYVREQQVKNHLVYIVQSHINNKVNQGDLDMKLQIIPYFEYLARQNLSLDDIDDYSNDHKHEYVDIDQIRVHLLEREVLRIIRRMMFA